MSDILAKHWFELAGIKRPCKLEGFNGPLDATIQFPLRPNEPATVESSFGAVRFTINLPTAARRYVEAQERGEIPSFYYS